LGELLVELWRHLIEVDSEESIEDVVHRETEESDGKEEGDAQSRVVKMVTIMEEYL
jgi:hypothetical protein